MKICLILDVLAGDFALSLSNIFIVFLNVIDLQYVANDNH